MTDDKKTDHVEKLLEKASNAGDSGDAMRFSQAAVNAANALALIKNTPAHSPCGVS